ncbi:hypothetical protein GCM10010335_26180 [Streptomyces galbus]|nr:hypothetical protein GCM10010335_26180 [Streptomyces galbus]
MVRAKVEIRDARGAYRAPRDAGLAGRLAVVRLVFTEGCTGDHELCSKAVRRGRLLAEPMPDEPRGDPAGRPCAAGRPRLRGRSVRGLRDRRGAESAVPANERSRVVT